MYLQNVLYNHHTLPKTVGQRTYHKTLQKWSPKLILHLSQNVTYTTVIILLSLQLTRFARVFNLY